MGCPSILAETVFILLNVTAINVRLLRYMKDSKNSHRFKSMSGTSSLLSDRNKQIIVRDLSACTCFFLLVLLKLFKLFLELKGDA